MYEKHITLAGCAAIVVEADTLGGMVQNPAPIEMTQRISGIEDEHGQVFVNTRAGSAIGL
jgi:hypothetical protein